MPIFDSAAWSFGPTPGKPLTGASPGSETKSTSAYFPARGIGQEYRARSRSPKESNQSITAIMSISTWAAFGKAATPIVERAGYGSLK